MKKLKTCILLALAAALCLALTACGDKTGSGNLKLVEAGKLIMATNAAFPPYEMVDDSGNFTGIDVEVATEIAKKLGLELEIMDVDFDAALLAVQNGQSDIAMAGITVKPDRQEVMDFSNFYAKGVQVVIVPEGSDITLDNLGDQLIGTQRGTTGFDYCSDDYGQDHVVAYDNGATAVQALINGQVDCVVIDNEPAKAFVEANAGLTILDTAYADEDYAIALAKGSELLEPVNKALQELIDDGTVAKIVGKYIKAE